MLIIVIFWIYLFPSEVKIQVQTSADTMTIGEMLVYTLQYTYPEHLRPAGEPQTDFSDFEITRIQEYEPVRKDKMITRKTEYVLTTFNVDTFLIRGPKLAFVSRGDTLTVQGESRMVIVKSVLDTTATDIRPEKPIIEGEIDWTALMALGAAAVAAIGLAGYFLFRWYRNYQRAKLMKALQKPVIMRTPEAIALEELEQIQMKNYIRRGDYKLFHIEVSNVIRRYLENGWKITALEMPTSDLIAALKKEKPFRDSYVQLLRRFLEVCDLVKFAKYPASPEESNEIMEHAHELIRSAQAHANIPPPVTQIPEPV